MGELMKALGLAGGLVGALALSATLVHVAYAEDIVEMISKYRQQHGLSAVKVDPELTKVAERQAKAMADTGIMDHSVAGSFGSRISGIHTGMAAENIAAGSKTWADTLRMWENSPGHNANLLQSHADTIGVAVSRNDQTRYKVFWAMVIADKAGAPGKGKKGVRVVADDDHPYNWGTTYSSLDNPFTSVKNFVCKYLC
jgi:Cysteine-rich secretory protein family